MFISATFQDVIEAHPAYSCLQPSFTSAPVIMESPHHSDHLPEGFRFDCDPIHIMRQVDWHIGRMISPLVEMGLPVLRNVIHRGLIDLNRGLDSVHPDHVKGPITRLKPNPKDTYAANGLGLVRTQAYFGSDVRVRNELPTEDEILSLIEAYWQPYHDKLRALRQANQERFGQSVHVTCHSFPMANMREKDELGDFSFFIGTRDDTSCDPTVKWAVIEALTAEGFKVADNHVLRGVELTRAHGNPEKGQHSIQIEAVREHYMDLETFQPHQGFHRIQRGFEIIALTLKDLTLSPRQKPAPSSVSERHPLQPDQLHAPRPGE